MTTHLQTAIEDLQSALMAIEKGDLQQAVSWIASAKIELDVAPMITAADGRAEACARCGERIKGATALSATLCGLCADDELNARAREENPCNKCRWGTGPENGKLLWKPHNDKLSHLAGDRGVASGKTQ